LNIYALLTMGYSSSFVVGSLPLTLSLSSSHMRLISALGMGVLIGTSLIVIIPEGVETLYSSTSVESHSHHRRTLAPGTISARWELAGDVPSLILPRARDDADSHSFDHSSDSKRESESDKDKDKDKDDDKKSDDKEPTHKQEKSPHAWIGVGLVSGFILMYLIDQLPQFAKSASSQQQRPYHISLDNLGSGLGRGGSPARSGFLDFSGTSKSPGFSTTLGLVIHAAADGIALGASSSSTSLSFIIFVAIMVHKAPASFGLTSVLLKQGVSVHAARTHLFIFSLAAPVGAILTWVLAHTIFAGSAGDEQAARWRTGMLLLFSAGTFL
jgi:zinc transporter 9